MRLSSIVLTGAVAAAAACSAGDASAPRTTPVVAGRWASGDAVSNSGFDLTLAQSPDGTLSGSALSVQPQAFRVTGRVTSDRRITFHMEDTVFVSIPYDYAGTVETGEQRITGLLTQLPPFGSPLTWVRRTTP